VWLRDIRIAELNSLPVDLIPTHYPYTKQLVVDKYQYWICMSNVQRLNLTTADIFLLGSLLQLKNEGRIEAD